MKVVSHAPQFEAGIHDKVDRTARPLYRDQVRGAVPVVTGRLRGALVATYQKLGNSHSRVTVSAPLPYGLPLERGANVGPRRGPHMTGQHRVEQVTRERWADVVSTALREQ